MKDNEKYWLNLYNEGLIKIDFEKGLVYSNLSGNWHLLGKGKKHKRYVQSSAGPSRQERNQILLHRLIWIVANGDIPENIEVNHINGIKDDNRLENLELVTKSEQALHSRRILGNKGGSSCAEKSGKTNITWDIVHAIRREYKYRIVTLKQLAKKYGISYESVWDIIKFRVWKEEVNQ
jgi:hypothetical protein